MSTKNTTIKTFNELLPIAEKIGSRKDFSTYCNTREFEEELSDTETTVNMDDELAKNIKQFINDNYLERKSTCFVLFVILFTAKRHQKKGDLEHFTNEFLPMFISYPINRFFDLLMRYNVRKDSLHLYELLYQCRQLTESKGHYYDFTTHNGIINLYVEVVCSYFELNLDKRERLLEKIQSGKYKPENKKNNTEENYITDALDKIDFVIQSEEEKKGKAYRKFYLNKGRLEILIGNYDVGEQFIMRAIQEIPQSTSRKYTVQQYEAFLSKADMIRLHDINNAKIKELQSTKVDNIKSLSIMTTLLGFILGSINIFSKVTEVKTLAILLITYSGLLGIILGTVLIGIKMLYGEKNKKLLVYSVAVLIIGIIVVATGFIIIYKG